MLSSYQKGYCIHLYRNASELSHNSENYIGCNNNNTENNYVESYASIPELLAFGDFESLQIKVANSFHDYHNLSQLSNDCVCEEKSILLYPLNLETDCNLFYNEVEESWYHCNKGRLNRKFLGISLLTLSSQAVEESGDRSKLLIAFREKIHTIIDEFNNREICDLECEVFDTFNTSEICVIWISDQYVDMLHITDYIRYITISSEILSSNCSVFLNAQTIIAINKQSDANGIKGDALVQLKMNKALECPEELKFLETELTKGIKAHVRSHVDDYDLSVEMSAEHAVRLMLHDGILNTKYRKEAAEKNNFESHPEIKSNIRLFYERFEDSILQRELEKKYLNNELKLNWDEHPRTFNNELMNSESDQLEESLLNCCCSQFREIRDKLNARIPPSVSVINDLTLLFIDFYNVVTSIGNKLRISDLCQQFKAMLLTVNIMLSYNGIKWSMDYFCELTNAIRQQINHLVHSGNLSVRISNYLSGLSVHYNFLVQAYYGISKKVLEIIYLTQHKGAKSKCVPLITVNAVPRKSVTQYFETDEEYCRIINLNIPNSLMFDLQIGMWYMTHKIFYSVAYSYQFFRNCNMIKLLLTMHYKHLYFFILRDLLSTKSDGTLDSDIISIIDQLISDNDSNIIARVGRRFYYDIVNIIIESVKSLNEDKLNSYFNCESSFINGDYKILFYKYVSGCESMEFITQLFFSTYNQCTVFLNDIPEIGDKNALNKMQDRIVYCIHNKDFLHQFIDSRRLNSSRDINDEKDQQIDGNMLNNYFPICSIILDACSDVAMVSLNGLTLIDYELYCAQTWTEFNDCQDNVLYNLLFSTGEWIRYGLVTEYFLLKGQVAWTCYNTDTQSRMVSHYCVLNKKESDEFRKRYIWDYYERYMKNTSPNHTSNVIDVFKVLEHQANEWIDFFIKSRFYFLKDICVYFDMFLYQILSEFDIEKRVEALRTNNSFDISDRVSFIVEELHKRIYMPYREVEEIIVKGLNTTIANQNNIDQLNEQYQARRFKHDISVAQYFQKQPSFADLEELCDSIKEKQNNQFCQHEKEDAPVASFESIASPPSRKFWEFHVRHISELFYYMRYCYDELLRSANQNEFHLGSNQKSMVWFRGHTSEAYRTIPTLMRNFDKEAASTYGSLSKYQLYNYEDFKTKADGVPEMSPGLRFTFSDYLALMQHYGAYTNFLDWTENAFVSLYLALKYFISQSTVKDPYNRNTVLLMFHPGLYNAVRMSVLDNLTVSMFSENETASKYFDFLLKEREQITTTIPNLSTDQNENYYGSFLMGDAVFNKFLKNAGNLNGILDDCLYDIQDIYSPLAILTSRLNPRIRTQCGCFVAYNLYTHLNINDNNPFEYVSLESIQERHVDKGIFLYKIVIDKECCQEVAKWLTVSGMSDSNVFPEFSMKKFT